MICKCGEKLVFGGRYCKPCNWGQRSKKCLISNCNYDSKILGETGWYCKHHYTKYKTAAVSNHDFFIKKYTGVA